MLILILTLLLHHQLAISPTSKWAFISAKCSRLRNYAWTDADARAQCTPKRWIAAPIALVCCSLPHIPALKRLIIKTIPIRMYYIFLILKKIILLCVAAELCINMQQSHTPSNTAIVRTTEGAPQSRSIWPLAFRKRSLCKLPAIHLLGHSSPPA